MDGRRELGAKLALAFGVTSLGLMAMVLYLLAQPRLITETLLHDPAMRAEAAAILARQSPGLWDSFPDPSVGRVLQANATKSRRGVDVHSNAFGLREKDYILPKPKGLLRIVLLGDSMVFGEGVQAEERCGVWLERELSRRLPDVPAVEVIHMGLSSWNIEAECEFLRRQLSSLQPDLVIHFTVPNDLDDCQTVRGMGVPASFTAQRRHAGVGLVSARHPRLMGFNIKGTLAYGLDYESLSRFENASREIVGLRDRLASLGAPYVLILLWPGLVPTVLGLLAPELTPKERAIFPGSFLSDIDYRLSKDDGHWNPAGQIQVFRYLYALIQRRGLLRDHDLPSWPEADEVYDAFAQKAEVAMSDDESSRVAKAAGRLVSSIDFRALNRGTASQIHGGIDRDGYAAPYASLILEREGRNWLVIEGEFLDRSEIEGGAVTVFVDEVEVKTLTVRAAETFAIRERLGETSGSPFVSVRFVANDYCYRGNDLRQCVSLRLSRVAAE